VLFDANVILDVLARRDPHYAESAAAWASAEAGAVRGFVAAHTVTTLHFLLSRHAGAARASAAVTDLLGVFAVAPVDGDVLRAALALSTADFEDCVQAAAAVRGNLDHLVTRDPHGFRGCPLAVLSPAELVALARSL
jgi:predicted nucleic acid-binding protein